MTYEAGFCVFAFIVFCCVLVYALYRRALAVEHSQQLDDVESLPPQHWNFRCTLQPIVNIKNTSDELLSRDDVLELAARFDTDSLESGNSKIPPRPFTNGKPIPKGWQPWEGDSGWPPVAGNIRVFVMMRNGYIVGSHVADYFTWNNYNSAYDILAYRIAD